MFYFLTLHPSRVKDTHDNQYSLIKEGFIELEFHYPELEYIFGRYELGKTYKELHYHGLYYCPEKIDSYKRFKIKYLRVHFRIMRPQNYLRTINYIKKSAGTDLESRAEQPGIFPLPPYVAKILSAPHLRNLNVGK